MIPKKKKIIKNRVLNRFFPVPEPVLRGLEPEPKIGDFTILKELGSGSFGRVLLVEHKGTKAQYAIKAIDKRIQDNIDEKPYFRREMEIMYKIHHPNVVKLFGHFEDNTFCYFLMEYISGGNLYSLVPKRGKSKITKQQTVSIIKDVISALYYLHHMNPPIIHRDIKPENILIDEGMRAKLSDFGWSNYLFGDFKRTTICGTPIYLAPEIISNIGHDEKIDIWCLGVLIFELTTGKAPWKGDDVKTVKYNISQLNINWPKNMDKDTRDLISKILRIMPEERPSLRQILMHPFFTKYYPYAVNCLQTPNYSNEKLYIISKDHPLTYNAGLSNLFNEGNTTPYSYSNDKALTQSNYNSLASTNYTQLKNTELTSQLEYNLTKNNGYTVTKINNSLSPLDYNTGYNVTKLNDSISPNNYNIIRNTGYTVTPISYNNMLNDLFENQERINELVRKTTLSNNKNYKDNIYQSIYNNLNYNNYEIRSKPDLYQTQYKSQKSYYSNNNNSNLYNINNSINNDKIQFSLTNTLLSNNINYDNYSNYNHFSVMNDPDILRLKEQERLRRESERIKLTNLINRYGMSLNTTAKYIYNFL